MSFSWFLQTYHLYGLFTAYPLYEEVMSVKLYVTLCLGILGRETITMEAETRALYEEQPF